MESSCEWRAPDSLQEYWRLRPEWQPVRTRDGDAQSSVSVVFLRHRGCNSAWWPLRVGHRGWRPSTARVTFVYGSWNVLSVLDTCDICLWVTEVVAITHSQHATIDTLPAIFLSKHFMSTLPKHCSRSNLLKRIRSINSIHHCGFHGRSRIAMLVNLRITRRRL